MDERTLIGNATQVMPPPESGAEATVIGGAGERTQMGTPVSCPVCQAQNAPAEVWCAECGFKLSATPGEAAPAPSGPSATLRGEGGNAYTLLPGENTLGRQGATLLLDEPTVSRKHAKITLLHGGLQIEDLESSNGTFVNDQRLSPGQIENLSDGDEIRLGNAALTVELRESEAPEDVEVAEANPNVTRQWDTLQDVEPEPSVDKTTGPRLVLPGGEEFPLDEGVAQIGRREGNDLVLKDSYASGKHAQIVREGVSVCVVDLNSTNGTLLNGQRLKPEERAPLQDGDRLRFGETEATFIWPDDSPDETISDSVQETPALAPDDGD